MVPGFNQKPSIAAEEQIFFSQLFSKHLIAGRNFSLACYLILALILALILDDSLCVAF